MNNKIIQFYRDKVYRMVMEELRERQINFKLKLLSYYKNNFIYESRKLQVPLGVDLLKSYELQLMHSNSTLHKWVVDRVCLRHDLLIQNIFELSTKFEYKFPTYENIQETVKMTDYVSRESRKPLTTKYQHLRKLNADKQWDWDRCGQISRRIHKTKISEEIFEIEEMVDICNRDYGSEIEELHNKRDFQYKKEFKEHILIGALTKGIAASLAKHIVQPEKAYDQITALANFSKENELELHI